MKSLFVVEKLCVDIRDCKFKYIDAQYDKRERAVDIKKYGSIDFPQVKEDGENPFESSEAVKVIKNLIKKENIKTKDVYINISDPSIVLRVIKIPYMMQKDITEYLNMEITQYLPVDLESNLFDYKIEGEIEENGKKFMNLMLVSVPKKLVSSYASLFKKAGLKPQVVDVYPNSMARFFGKTNNQNIAVVEINKDTIDFVVIKNGDLYIYISLPLENKLEYKDTAGKTISDLIVEDEEFVASINEIINYIRTYMDFFSSRHFGRNVDKVYLVGQIILFENIDTYLSGILGIEVKSGIEEVLKVELSTSFKDNSIELQRRITPYLCSLGLLTRDI